MRIVSSSRINLSKNKIVCQGSMAVSALRLIPIALLTLICSFQASSGTAQEEDVFPYLTNGQVYISEDFGGGIVRDSQSLNGTDYYFIQSNFMNSDKENKSFSQVYYVVMVLDQDGIAQLADLHTYGEKAWSGNQSSLFSGFYNPQLPGKYTIKTFLISGLDTPQVLTRVATFNVTVKEKIDKLGESQENYRLHVESIDSSNNSVKIDYNFCDEIRPFIHKANATLYVGDHVSINAADAYFMGLEDGKAVFKFVANGGSDACLI